MRFRLLIPPALALGVFAQDQSARTPGAGINFYSLDKEIALGAQLAEPVRAESMVLDSDLVQDYVARLGAQLALQAAGPKFTYTFSVIADLPGGIRQDPTHEPLALPGGPIFIPGSLILAAESTAELAGMMAHAIAHVADRDCTRSATRLDLIQVDLTQVNLRQIGGAAALPLQGCWAGGANGQAIPLGYIQFQRAFERQADYFAVQIMAKAGYDPAALAAYIHRVHPSTKQSVSSAFSLWPTADERVKQIEKEIGKLPPDRRYPAGEDIQPIQLKVRNLRAKQ
jgi:predicted Zn-dependent protease